jgi:excinuclease UvrABC nuclease subunit
LLDGEQIAKLALPWQRSSGVYFLVQDQEVVYVGQSVNIYSRIAQHPDKKFDKYAFVPCEVELLDKLESLYIHTLKPRLNGNVSKQEKSAPIRLDNLLRMI